MKQKTFIILILGHFYLVLAAQKLSPGQMKQDFEIFRTSLEETHPGLYRFTSVEWFDSAFQSTAARLQDSLSGKEFYRLLAPLVASVKCGHVKFFPEGDVNRNQFHYFYDTTRLFPFRLFFTDEDVRISGNYSGDPQDNLYGAVLVAINGIPVKEIKEKLLHYIPADGNVVSGKYLELNNYFPAYYANFIDSPDSFLLDLKLPDRHPERISVKPVSMADLTAAMKTRGADTGSNFSLAFPEDNIAVMKIRGFYPLSPADNYKRFLKQSFRELKARNINHLVLDLRDNEGGKDRWGALLYSYLAEGKFNYYKELRLTGTNFSTEPYLKKPRFFGILRMFVREKDGKYYWTRHKNLRVQKPQKTAFHGKVYVLVNGNSYSVTSEFASIARSNQRAMFFGQETGGAYEGNNSGTFAFVQLPNSKLTLAIPMLAYYLDVKPVNPMDRGILPDVYIPSSLDGKDDEMKTVLDYIRPARF